MFDYIKNYFNRKEAAELDKLEQRKRMLNNYQLYVINAMQDYIMELEASTRRQTSNKESIYNND